ncbi:hypothetical protein [Pandoraea pulmonicola]|uniref:hypothetical protein n=1 Tax=Pandoraea pulmonicola TaxID=93221 RepID=UPI000AFA1208|nr:hypothetical protein [Pandoraea pulmonicola]
MTLVLHKNTAIELLHKPVMRYCHCLLHIAGARSLPEDDKRAYCAKPHMDMLEAKGLRIDSADRPVGRRMGLSPAPKPARR